jgi:hypothetical protein
MYLPCCSGTTVPRLRTSDSYLSQPQTSRHPPVRPLRPQRITNLSRNRITLVDHAVISHAPLPTTGYRRRQVGSYRPLPSRSSPLPRLDLLSCPPCSLSTRPIKSAVHIPSTSSSCTRIHSHHIQTALPTPRCPYLLPTSTPHAHAYAHSQPRHDLLKPYLHMRNYPCPSPDPTR